MQTTDLHYKLLKKIKDERFEEDKLDQYVLNVQLGVRDLQTCVIDSADDRVLLLEDFILPAVGTQGEWLSILDDLFDDHALLKANFWKKINVSVKNSKFVLVPGDLFAADKVQSYLKFNAPVYPDREVFLYCKSKRSDVVTCFSYEKDLHDWLSAVYPQSKPQLLHQAASLIEGALQYSKETRESPLLLFVDRFKLHILFCKAGKLIYYNQFVIKQFADYIKYIMLVMNSLKLNQQSGKVVLWGYIGKNSPHYHEFYRYIQNVTFGGRPHTLRFGYLFDELQEHHFFDLFNLYLLG